jgi:hypothetical protein
MIFELKTLIDITETGARRGDDPREQQQQQNFYTALQTISLRANPTVDRSPRSDAVSIKGLGFGSKYTGKQQVWTWRFSFEQADSHNIDFLNCDFDLVPVILNLDETARIENAAFITSDSQYRNTVFLIFDDK